MSALQRPERARLQPDAVQPAVPAAGPADGELRFQEL